MPTIHLTISAGDPFVAQEISSLIVRETAKHDATLTPASKGTMSGASDFILQLAQNVHDHQELLIALAKWGTTIVELLAKLHTKNETDVVAIDPKREVTLTRDQRTNEELLRDLLADDPDNVRIEIRHR